MKVWHLPEAAPTAKGRALVNLLPDMGEDTITAVLPLPQDEALWDDLHLAFATARGNVRRNRLSDFRNIRASGLIAMKLDEGDQLIGVATCREGQDVFLATRRARAIRFQITDSTLRVFAGRGSTGVRGIRLAGDDRVVSLCILDHVEASASERAAYLRLANSRGRGSLDALELTEGEEENAQGLPEDMVPDMAEAEGDDGAEGFAEDGEGVNADEVLDEARYEALMQQEELLLTVSNSGFGRRSSAYDYRVSGRGGQGLLNMRFPASRPDGEVVGALTAREGTDVMLVTDTGRLIRLPVAQVRVMSRMASGVTLFRVDEDEHIISVFPVLEAEEDEGEEGAEEGVVAGSEEAAGLAVEVPSPVDVTGPVEATAPESDVAGSAPNASA